MNHMTTGKQVPRTDLDNNTNIRFDLWQNSTILLVRQQNVTLGYTSKKTVYDKAMLKNNTNPSL
jgi:hypothetical protein